jgi:hypothetical protein
MVVGPIPGLAEQIKSREVGEEVMLIGLAIICHVMLDNCIGVTLTEPGNTSRLYFESEEECNEAFQERIPSIQRVFFEALGPAMLMGELNASLFCITEEEAQEHYGITPQKVNT